MSQIDLLLLEAVLALRALPSVEPASLLDAAASPQAAFKGHANAICSVAATSAESTVLQWKASSLLGICSRHTLASVRNDTSKSESKRQDDGYQGRDC